MGLLQAPVLSSRVKASSILGLAAGAALTHRMTRSATDCGHSSGTLHNHNPKLAIAHLVAQHCCRNVRLHDEQGDLGSHQLADIDVMVLWEVIQI